LITASGVITNYVTLLSRYHFNHRLTLTESAAYALEITRP